MLKKLLLVALPMVVSNAFALETQQWAAIEPAVRAALECRQPLAEDKLKNVTPRFVRQLDADAFNSFQRIRSASDASRDFHRS